MTNRQQRARIAEETINVLDRGSYTVYGRDVCIAEELAECCRNTRLYPPDELNQLIVSLDPPIPVDMTLSVSNCTTFAAARVLLNDGFDDPLCLNFASAKNPGGGFLSGSQAQEECLARASALYASLRTQPAYYEANRRSGTSLYTNHAIYSPGVPVFRDDEDALLAVPYSVSMVTSPAVNAGAVRNNEPDNVAKIEATMRQRIASVLAIARNHGHRALVLGAWGCGVFGNEPTHVARWFRDALTTLPESKGAFERVTFAVLDVADGTPTVNAFQRSFADDAKSG